MSKLGRAFKYAWNDAVEDYGETLKSFIFGTIVFCLGTFFLVLIASFVQSVVIPHAKVSIAIASVIAVFFLIPFVWSIGANLLRAWKVHRFEVREQKRHKQAEKAKEVK